MKTSFWKKIQVALAIALIVIAPLPLEAATRTWSGTATSGLWNVASNWGGTLPVNNDVLVFGNASPHTSLNNNLSGLVVGSTSGGTAITFNQAQAYTLSGNSITLLGNIVTAGTPSSPLSHAINLGLVFNGNISISPVQNNDLVINGVISESGGPRNLFKGGLGNLTLNGLNTFTGNFTAANGSTFVNSIAASGVASAVGSGNQINIGNAGNNATLVYTGSGSSTIDRAINLTATTGAQATLSNTGTGVLTFTGNFSNAGTGNKTFILRGTNTGANEIQSVISNGTAGGTLALTKQDAGQWVLSGVNTYTGVTSVQNGILTINSLADGGVASAAGAGTQINLGSGTNVAGALNFVGSSDTISNRTIVLAATTTGAGTVNNNGSGTLTLTGQVSSSATSGTKNFNLGGTNTGMNEVSGVIANGSGGTTQVVKNGAGTWKLSGANTYSGNTVISQGTLVNGAANAIPGSLVLQPVAGLNGTFDLNGFNASVNALNMTSAGTGIVDNTSVSPVTLQIGTLDGSPNVAPGVGGSFSLNQSGGGAVSLLKVGAGNAVFAAGTNLNHSGSTSVTSGILNISGNLTATTSLSATGSGSLALLGDLTNPNLITSLTLGGGASMSFANGTGVAIPNLSSLSLGSPSQTSTLTLEIGSSSDTLTATTAALVNGTINFNLSGIAGLSGATQYNLLQAPSGLSAGTYNVASHPGGFSAGTLTVTDSLVYYTSGSAIVGNLYYNNTQGNGSWAFNNAGQTNFTTDAAGTIDGTFTPGPGTTVIFGATNNVTTATMASNLNSNFSVAGLKFIPTTGTPSGSVPVTAWTIGSGTPPTSSLTIGGDGIDVSSNAGAVTISAPVALSANQTWNVSGTGVSSLTVASGVSGSGFGITKTGSGLLVLGGNSAFTGGLKIEQGTVDVTAGGASGTVANTITLGAASGSDSASFFSQLSGSGTAVTASPIVLGGTIGQLTIGSNTTSSTSGSHTFTGGVTGNNNLVVASQSSGNGGLIFNNNSINNVGTATFTGTSTTATIVNSVLGSNLTEVIQDSSSTVLSLRADNSSYVGGITVKRGILDGQAFSNSLGGSGNTITLGDTSGSNNSTLRFGGTVASLSQASDVVVAGGNTGIATITTSNTSGTATLNGSITMNNHDLSITTGTATTSGGMTFTGGVNGTGNLTISNGSGGGGVINFNTNALNFTGSISNAGTAGTGGVSIASNIGANVTAINQNSVTSPLALGGNNTFSGPVNLNAGTLRVNSNSALGAGGTLTIGNGTTLANTSGSIVNNSGSNPVVINGNFSFAGPLTLNLGNGPVNLGTSAGTSRTITVTASDLILGGDIANGSTANDLVKAGPGTLTLAGNNTYTGTTDIQAGTLRIGNNSASGSIVGNVTNSGTLMFDRTDVSNFGNTISGTGTVVQQGTGTTFLTGSNTYSGETSVLAGTLVTSGTNSTAGGTTINGGTLRLNNAANGGLASGTLTFTAGSLQAINDDRSISNPVNFTAGTVSGSRSVTLGTVTGIGNANRTLNSSISGAGKSLTIGALQISNHGSVRSFIIDGTGPTSVGLVTNGNAITGNLVIANSNTTTLTAPNSSFTGSISLNEGTTVVSTIGASGVNSSIGAGSQINMGSGTNTGATLVYNGTGDSTNRTLNLAATASGGATISNVGTGALSFTGAFTNAGTSGTKTLTLTGTNSGANTIASDLVNGSGTNVLAVTKAGTGSWTLTGTNTYTGGTNVNAGTLVINGNNSGATGNVTVASGATLAGTGSVGGSTFIQSGGFHSPGNSPGIQTVTSISYAPASTLIWELIGNTNSAGDRGTQYDGVNGTGTLSIDPLAGSSLVFDGVGSTVNWTDAFWTTNRSWSVFEGFANGPANGFLISLISNDSAGNPFGTGNTAGGSFSWTVSPNGAVLNYTAFSAIPEPASFGGALVLLGSWFARRRSNRRG